MTKQDYVNKGLQHFAERNYERASHLFRKAICCDDQFENAYRALSETLNRMNQIDEALALTRKWLIINKHNPIAHLTLSKLCVQKGLKSEAQRALKRYHVLIKARNAKSA